MQEVKLAVWSHFSQQTRWHTNTLRIKTFVIQMAWIITKTTATNTLDDKYKWCFCFRWKSPLKIYNEWKWRHQMCDKNNINIPNTTDDYCHLSACVRNLFIYTHDFLTAERTRLPVNTSQNSCLILYFYLISKSNTSNSILNIEFERNWFVSVSSQKKRNFFEKIKCK